MKRKVFSGFLAGLLGFLFSCTSVYKLKELPEGPFTLSSAGFKEMPAKDKPQLAVGLKADLHLTDSALIVQPVSEDIPETTIPFRQIKELKFYRRTFDVDILTIPFKVRPSVKGFPEQLNPNFSAALYLGSRKDFYRLENPSKRQENRLRISGLGFGYGGFIGIGSVTMDPFVTQNKINYEYDGFVLTAGAAGIYDVKKINIGIAIGMDHLVDKNREFWIYQNRPWFGVLFGINLN
jgi:hypothetical protein